MYSTPDLGQNVYITHILAIQRDGGVNSREKPKRRDTSLFRKEEQKKNEEKETGNRVSRPVGPRRRRRRRLSRPATRGTACCGGTAGRA